MGGGRRFEYPKFVWSPAGGWWANPTHWRRNTVLYIAFSAFVCYQAVKIAEPKTVKYERKEPTLALDDHGSHH